MIAPTIYAENSLECADLEVKAGQKEFQEAYVEAIPPPPPKTSNLLATRASILRWQTNYYGLNLLRFLTVSFPAGGIKVAATYVRILRDQAIYLKLAKALAGKGEWTAEDKIVLRNALLDIPKMALTRTMRWGLPGGTILYASLATSHVGTYLLPNAFYRANLPRRLKLFFDGLDAKFVESIDALKAELKPGVNSSPVIDGSTTKTDQLQLTGNIEASDQEALSPDVIRARETVADLLRESLEGEGIDTSF
jgi:hypothetical protein